MRAFERILICVLAALLATSAKGTEPATFSEAVTSGALHLNFRYRLESVDQDGFMDKATASTLRTRVNYGTAPWRDFNAFIEVDNISYIGSDRFNNTRNGRSRYPTVADPDGTDLNQLYIKYAPHDAGVILGRQRINLDNQRFVGGVGWRQNEQTYDALEASFSGLARTRLLYAYVDRVARVFGPDAGSPPSSLDSNSHIVHVAYDAEKAGKIVAYGYFLDIENAASLSSRTIGVRYTNSFVAGDFGIPVTLEFARQSDFGDNPLSYGASYVHVEAGLAAGAVQFIAGDEVLGSDSGAGVAFSTPLATLHGFQGWADKFLATPAAGIDDRYVTIKTKDGGTSMALTWHDFDADTGSMQYGNEVDFSVGFKLAEHANLLVKYAAYNANAYSTDTQKFWIMLTAGF